MKTTLRLAVCAVLSLILSGCQDETRLISTLGSLGVNSVTEAVVGSAVNCVEGTDCVINGFIAGVKESFYNNVIKEDRYLLLIAGLKETVVITIFSVILGTIMGAFVCFMRMSKNILFQFTAKSFITAMRGTPILVFLMIMFYVVFASIDIDPAFVAVIAFGLNFAAYVSEMFRTGIESIDKGQTEAGIALGFSKTKTFVYIILPQVIKRILPVYKGEFISLLKMTSIVGYVAIQDLTKASDIIRARTFDAFFPLVMVALIYFALSWGLTLALDYLEFKMTPKRRKL